MKSVQAKMTSVAALLLALLAISAYAAQDEAGASDYQNQIGPVDPPAGTAANDTEKKQGQREDVLDRAFAPVDNAISDINRTINKEGDGETSDPGD